MLRCCRLCSDSVSSAVLTISNLDVFTARGSAVYATALCLCLCVCLSVTGRCSFDKSERIKLFLATEDSFDLSCIVLQRNLCIFQIQAKGDFSGTLFQSLELEKNLAMARRPSRTCQLSSSDDNCRQLITLSVHHCVQHDGCRVCPTAGAETCCLCSNFTTSVCRKFLVQQVMLCITNPQQIDDKSNYRSHPEMVGDMSCVTLNFDLSKIPFVHFQPGSRPILTPKIKRVHLLVLI